MRHSLAVLLGFVILPAFGAVMPFRADDAILRGTESSTDNATVARTTTNSGRGTVASRAIQNERNTGRVVASNSSAVLNSGVSSENSRVVAARGANVARTTTARSVTTNPVASRTIVPTASNTTNSRVSISAKSGSTVMSRVPKIRVASTTSLSNTETSETTTASTLAEMDNLAEMTDYCKSQYASCMDNYCNVLDDNQGRCSCSANIKSYAKAESALKAATEELQEVAQKIQYIGLTSREVETLFNETEAELAMQTNTDTSAIKTSLDKIKDMLIEVRTGTASSDASNLSGFGFDMNGLLDFTIDSTGFDISSFLGTFGTNTNSVTNQRGEELYKTAVNRCKSAVLKSCTNQGVDANLITNSYDLQIDKECILYERSLSDANDQMVSTIRNAKSVLQKARLLVSQQKNVYDMRGCINALDSCMQDEFVCGTDYENCLDPTGRYIVNGAIVLGSQPGHAIDPTDTTTSSVMTSDVCAVNLYRTWDMPGAQCSEGAGNAWGSGPSDTLANYIEQTVTANAASTPSTNMAIFLQNKIGYVNNTRNFGMCISVLNKCQDYTYTGDVTNAQYNPQNDVIKQYLSRALIQIKAKQDQILSDYADSCVADVTSCLSQNNYPSTASAVSSNSMSANIAINACRPTIVTCMSVNGYSTNTPNPEDIKNWVFGLSFPDPEYTISYVCDSTEEVVATQNVRAGASFVVKSGDICTNPASGFQGWTMSQSGSSEGGRAASTSSNDGVARQYSPGQPVQYSWPYNITFTAKWQ